MPTYEYACEKCDVSFELFQSISAPKEGECPACGEISKSRLISGGAGFSLRGGGWAADNYSKTSQK